MELGLILLIAVILGGSVAGGLVTTWKLHRRMLRLEDIVNTLQDITTRQDKKAAAQVRWSKADLQAAELMKAQQRTNQPAYDPNPFVFPG